MYPSSRTSSTSLRRPTSRVLRFIQEYAVASSMTLLTVSVCGFGLLRGALIDEQRAINTLQSQGWTNVQVTSHHWLLPGLYGCDSHDAVMFGATATNPAGRRIDDVIVCMGMLKGGTIRTP